MGANKVTAACSCVCSYLSVLSREKRLSIISCVDVYAVFNELDLQGRERQKIICDEALNEDESRWIEKRVRCVQQEVQLHSAFTKNSVAFLLFGRDPLELSTLRQHQQGL